VASEIGATATKHGHELLLEGFTVDQVVHDYGDLCQAVTELAIEKKALVTADEFKTLNRCLDFAIADAVTEFDRQRDQLISDRGGRALSERLEFLAHELRSLLNTAVLSFAAIKGGRVGLQGATAAVLEKSLAGLRDLIDSALSDARLVAGISSQREEVRLARFIAQVQDVASADARAKGCEFTVSAVDPRLVIQVDKQLLCSAVSTLLLNAFKYTRLNGHVLLTARCENDRVLIEVEDQCGGLPAGEAEAVFLPLGNLGADRSGLQGGLSIARRAVEASGGKLRVRDVPGTGCVFIIDLPRRDDAV